MKVDWITRPRLNATAIRVVALAAASLLLLVLACSVYAPITGRAARKNAVRVKLRELAPGDKVLLGGKGLEWAAGSAKGAGDLLLAWDGRRVLANGRKVSLPLTARAEKAVTVDGLPYRETITITAGPPPLIVNTLGIESYVAGVINHEIDSAWPEAAVDAQAILARTYALMALQRGGNRDHDLDSTVSDQVYGGMAAEDKLAWAAVNRTRGLVLTFGGKPFRPAYHSCCGGRTELAKNVWGGEPPWSKSVDCPYCQKAPRYFWRYPEKGAVSGRELGGLLGTGAPVTNIEIASKTSTGRAALVKVFWKGGARDYSGNDFRKRIGYAKLFSLSFAADSSDKGFVFMGSGSGHGVGLCQWGARGMAERGFSSERILGYYYPGARTVVME